MPAVYIQKCRTFGEALNTILFELRVPEYYDPNLPSYYKEPRKTDPPVINGELVSWEEYYEKYPEQRDITRKPFVPLTVYKSEDYNMSVTKATISDIIDLCDNNVPFDFVNLSDLEWVVDLMDGYVTEVSPYIGFNKQLEVFLSRLRNARKAISEINEINKHYLENNKPIDKRRPKTLIEILNAMM